MLFQGDRSFTVLRSAEKTPNDRRAQPPRNLEHAAELLRGRAVLGLETVRRLANRGEADFKIETEAVGMSLDPVEVGFLQAAQETRFGEVRRLDAKLRAVVEQFEGRPVL